MNNIVALEQLIPSIVSALKTNPEIAAAVRNALAEPQSQPQRTVQVLPEEFADLFGVPARQPAVKQQRQARRLELLQADKNLAEDEADVQRDIAGLNDQIAKFKKFLAEAKRVSQTLAELEGRRLTKCKELKQIKRDREAVWKEWNESGYAGS